MKKKGFTLIELLAVIVILAIIALITVPLLISIIENSKKSAFADHVYGIMDAAHLYYADNLLKLEEMNSLEFTCNGFTCETDNGQKLKFKGDVPKSGKIILNSDNVEVAEITDGNYCASGNDKNLKISTDCITTPLEYITDGNIVRYDFDDSNNTSSTLYDLSGNNKNGTISGPVITGKGIFFDGNDHVKIGAINNPQITWEASFSISKYGVMEIISNAQQGGCELTIADNNKLRGYCYIGGSYKTIDSIEEIELNKIYTGSITYDGNAFKLYLNGELQGMVTDSSGIKNPESATIVMLGANPITDVPQSNSTYYLNGFISKVRIYNKALSEEEIKTNYQMDKKNSYEIENDVDKIGEKLDKYSKNGLQLHYSILNNSGLGYLESINYLADLSGNNKNGTLYSPVITDKGILFDGNDYVKIGQMNNPQITWEASFSISEYGVIEIVSNAQKGGCELSMANNKLRAYCYIDNGYKTIDSIEKIELNETYTGSITYDGSDFKLYLNGELQGTVTNSAGIKNPENATVIMLGANPIGSTPEGSYLKGLIKSVRIYNKALSKEEIKSNYNIDKELYTN